jgi:hypothetical protein
MPDFRPRPTALAQSLCNQATDAERHLWRHLSRRQLAGYKFSRQMPIGPFVCDFLCRDAHNWLSRSMAGNTIATRTEMRRAPIISKLKAFA